MDFTVRGTGDQGIPDGGTHLIAALDTPQQHVSVVVQHDLAAKHIHIEGPAGSLAELAITEGYLAATGSKVVHPRNVVAILDEEGDPHEKVRKLAALLGVEAHVSPPPSPDPKAMAARLDNALARLRHAQALDAADFINKLIAFAEEQAPRAEKRHARRTPTETQVRAQRQAD
jgi:hypothetical protein